MATNVKSYTTGDKSQNFYLNQHNQFISFAATGNTQLTTHAVGEVESLVADPVRLDVQPTGGGELFSIVNTGTDPSITRRIKYLGTESAFVKFSANGTISGEQPAPVVPAVVKVSVTRVAGTGTATVASSAKMDLENTTGNSRDFHLSGVGTVEPNDEYAITVSNVDNTEGWILENVYCEAQIVPDAIAQDQVIPPGAPAPSGGGTTALVLNYVDSVDGGNDDWRSGAGGTVTFPTAFGSAPAVVAQALSVDPSSTVAISNVTATEFDYYQPGESTSLQTNNIGDVTTIPYFTNWGWHFGTTDNLPVAMTYTSSTVPTGVAGYHFTKSLDSTGTNWSTLTTTGITNPNTTGSPLGITMGTLTTSGTILAFHYGSTGTALFMRRSTDVGHNGLSWSAPLNITPGISGGNEGYYPKAITLDNGQVCVCSFGSSNSNAVICTTTVDPPTVAGHVTVFDNPFDAAQLVYYPTIGKLANGFPYVLYWNQSTTQYLIAVANTADGLSWPSTGVVVVPSGNGWNTSHVNGLTTELVDGKPAICFRDSAAKTFKYVRCQTADGLTWDYANDVIEPVPFAKLPEGFAPSASIMMKMVHGVPSIIFGDITADQQGVYYIKALDATGSTWSPIFVKLNTTTKTGSITQFSEMKTHPVTGAPRLVTYLANGANNGNYFSYQDQSQTAMVLAAEPAP